MVIVRDPFVVTWILSGTIFRIRKFLHIVIWYNSSSGSRSAAAGKEERSAACIQLRKLYICTSQLSVITCSRRTVYTAVGYRYIADIRRCDALGGGGGGGSKSSRKISVSLAIVRARTNMASGNRLVSSWVSVTTDTTCWLCRSHHPRSILMVGGKVSSTRSQEKAKIFPSVLVPLVKETGRCSTPQTTCTCWGQSFYNKYKSRGLL